MKNRIAPLIGGILCASALSLSAQTFVEDLSGSPAVNSFKRVDGYPVGGANTTGLGDGIVFNNVGGVPDPYVIDPIGITVTEVTTATGTFTAFDLCSELFVGPNTSTSYSVTQGFGSLTANQQVLVAKLFSNTLSTFVGYHNGGNRPQAEIVGAAIQLAFWEIIEDQTTLAAPSLDPTSNPGNLSIVGYSGSYSGAAKDSMELAQTYLSQVNGWTDNGGLFYYSADPGSDQDRLWVTTQAIPEPSTALLAFLSMGFLLRRKRN